MTREQPDTWYWATSVKAEDVGVETSNHLDTLQLLSDPGTITEGFRLMGVAINISASSWPKQGAHLGKRVRVCFHYDTANVVMGTVVRDDNEEPWISVISLDTGRVILATECQYMLD